MNNRILIIGSCGAGKSTFAKQLSEKLNLPLISLDQCYWKSGWIRSEKEEWRLRVADLVKKKAWVMDGNHQGTFDLRFPVSDVIIVFDFNRWICFWGIWKRRILKDRIDKMSGCDEMISFDFIKWVLWDYPRSGKSATLDALEKYNKKAIFIKSRKELKNIDEIICQIKN